MQCPTCSQFNAATDVRCLNCRTTLIYEAEGHSKEFKKAAHTLDARMYSGIGALLGFFLVAGLLKFVFTAHWLSDREIYLAAALSGFVGSVIGLVFLRFKSNY